MKYIFNREECRLGRKKLSIQAEDKQQRFSFILLLIKSNISLATLRDRMELTFITKL